MCAQIDPISIYIIQLNLCSRISEPERILRVPISKYAFTVITFARTVNKMIICT